ncbi:secreted RxLR effector protein 161-like [Miscanthus floridulus]|uniref:secreted RxLR effector protein 161-like n=1 Tax=Miscanthus floridulus TaxID=154761 RepID=UPI0034586358
MEVRLKLSTKSTTSKVDATEYRSLIGSLRYLIHTCPDITFVVGYLSRFMETPRKEHLVAVKRLLRYIAGMVEFGILYSMVASGGNNKLMGYSDSDLGGDVDEQRCTTGVIFFLGDKPISWQSQKQE